MNNDPEMTIRTAMPGDHDSILELVRDAFTSDECDASAELDIVVSTRAGRAVVPELELVAVIGDVVVGPAALTAPPVAAASAVAAPSNFSLTLALADSLHVASACRSSRANG